MSIDLNDIDLSYYPDNEEEKNERQATFLSLKIMIELEKIRKQKRMKYSEIAEKLNLSKAFVSQLFSGDKLMNLKTLAKINQLFNLKVDFNFETLETEINQSENVISFKIMTEKYNKLNSLPYRFEDLKTEKLNIFDNSEFLNLTA